VVAVEVVLDHLEFLAQEVLVVEEVQAHQFLLEQLELLILVAVVEGVLAIMAVLMVVQE
jgi:hypothetical protein